MITTIIFDLDGTLMDTLDDLHESLVYALRSEGLGLVRREETRRFLGNGVKNLVWKGVEHVRPDADEKLRERVLNTFRSHYVAHSMERTAPYEGIPEMLRQCREGGYMAAIVSNKLDPAVKDLCRAFFADVIDVAVGEAPNMRRKPAPDMVEEAIRQLSLLHGRQIEREECVYVGDSEVDLLTAENSELPCISVSWGFRDRDFLVRCGAKNIIDRPEELLARVAHFVR